MADKIVTTDNLIGAPAVKEPDVLPDGTERKSSYDAATEGTPGAADGTKTDLGGVPLVTFEERTANMSDIDRMREYFAERPKVTVFIPADQDEHVIINGYGFHLKRGEQVEVPIDVAEVLRDAWKGRAGVNVTRHMETQRF